MVNKTKVEEWKTIEYCSGYQVNRHGQIRNKNTEKLLKLHVSSSGHTFVSLYADMHKEKISVYPNVLVKKLFGIELAVTRPSRRKWRSTKADPVRHNGTTRRKLSDQDIVQIRMLLRGGKFTQDTIAQMFGVAQATVSDIKCRVSWREIDKDGQKETVKHPNLL